MTDKSAAVRKGWTPERREAASRAWTPERREAWRQWVLENRPWERVKVRKTPEWREHLASICKKVDGYESKAFGEERRLLKLAIAVCEAHLKMLSEHNVVLVVSAAIEVATVQVDTAAVVPAAVDSFEPHRPPPSTRMD